MLRVGLTGGIGSGKSHVLRQLALAPDVRVLDLDAVSHQALAPGGVAEAEVVDAFGEAIRGTDGAIDRRRLGAIVFGDPLARERLNALVHPRVRAAEAAWVAEHARTGAILVTDAALIVETGMHLRFDRIVTTWCAAETQVRRVQSRDALPEDVARARVAAQMPGDVKRGFAHHVIDTEGPLEGTIAQVDELLPRLRALASRTRKRESISRARATELLQRSPAGGLDARVLLRHACRWSGLEMPVLAAEAGGTGPWYDRGDHDGAGGDGFAEGLALWALARRGDDPDWLASAAASVARLALPSGRPRAEAVLRTIEAAALVAAPGRGGAEDLARRWGGADPWPLALRDGAPVDVEPQLLDALLM